MNSEEIKLLDELELFVIDMREEGDSDLRTILWKIRELKKASKG